MVLVSHLLNGNNFNTWNRAMAMAFTAKNKLGFFDGSLPHPSSNNLLFNAWVRYNSIVISWILNFVSKDIADSLLYIDTVTAIWADLRERFHQSNRPRLFHINKHLIVLNQGALILLGSKLCGMNIRIFNLFLIVLVVLRVFG